MRISDLARRAGVPVGTVKYYLREGLLPPGELTSATQARYTEAHAERLTLIRTLVGVGGLSLTATRRVLAALDDPPATLHDVVGTAHAALHGDAEASPAALDGAREVVARHGWDVRPDAPALTDLGAALDGLVAGLGEDLGGAGLRGLVDRYAVAAVELAEGDVAAVPDTSPELAVRVVVAGTVLLEPLLLALRRLAQEDASARRFGKTSAGVSSPTGSRSSPS